MKNTNINILIITDSLGNPRSFPENSITSLQETYPYILRENFPNAVFWQLSFGNLRTEELINQVIGYLNHWRPDFIIIHSGINDCRPEAFSDFQKSIIAKFSGPFFRFLYKHLHNPRLIKFRNIQRVTKGSFKKSLKKMKMIFDNSDIIFLEISAGVEYENARPGVNKRMHAFNQIANDLYDGILPLQTDLIKKNGFTPDNLHLNVKGHGLVASKLVNYINEKVNYEE